MSYNVNFRAPFPFPMGEVLSFVLFSPSIKHLLCNVRFAVSALLPPVSISHVWLDERMTDCGYGIGDELTSRQTECDRLISLKMPTIKTFINLNSHKSFYCFILNIEPRDP